MQVLLLSALAAVSAGASCTLSPSGPIIITADNSVVENVLIRSTAAGGDALRVAGASNVTVRNVRIEHAPSGRGIFFQQADNINISGVEVVAVAQGAAPLRGANNCSLANNDCDNILGQSSAGVTISRVRLDGGSTGVELANCPLALVEQVRARNNRGPFPRGQCVQFTHSDGAVLQDFGCFNDNSSWTEDNVNVWRSSNVTVRRGIVDGNNSPTGVGIMFEMSDNATRGGTLEDVDALHQGDGCFSGYSARGLSMTRTRCAHNHCAGWAGRGKPASNALMWAAGDELGIRSEGIVVRDSQFASDMCNPGNVHWEASKGGFAGDTVDAVERDFTPRAQPDVRMCWD